MVPRPLARAPFAALACSVLASLPASAQESSAPFDAPLEVTGMLERFEAVADLNADGFADALSVWWDGTAYSQIHVRSYLNDQTGKLVPANPMSFGFFPALVQAVSPWHVAITDVDGNGLPDVLVACGAYVRLLRTLPDGNFVPSPPVVVNTAGTLIGGVRVGDYDQDGQIDLAVLTHELKLYHANPVTLAFTEFSSIPLGVVNASLFAVEMNGDGAPDLMVSDATNIRLCPIVGGQLQAPTIIPHQCGDPKPGAGDLDGDGDEDIVVWDMVQYTLLRRTSPTTYAIEYGHGGGPARFLYDLDGDGDLDGVCCGGGGPTQIFNTNASIYRLSFNDGHGNFAPALEMPGLGSFRLAGAADLDHDGDLDLVSGRCVFYARGPWKRVAAPTYVSNEPRPGSLVDFDGDADIDLELRTAGVRRNLGDGKPQTHPLHIPPAPAGTTWDTYPLSSSYSGDFDGDGDVDMIVSRWAGLPVGHSLSLLLNDGGGNFTDGGDAIPAGTTMSSFGSGPDPMYSFTADVDGDGDIDVVAGTRLDDNTRIWVNDGQGHFTQSAYIQPGHVQAVADLNNDGIPDLVGHRIQSGGPLGREATWRGLGNGTFAPLVDILPVVVVAEEFPTAAVADIDQDGDLDLTFGDYNGRLVLCLNHVNGGVTDLGPGQFTSYLFQTVTMLNSSTTVALDADGDGRLDIVAGPALYAPSTSWIVLRKHDNSGWETPFMQVMRAAATADMDGDGDLDAVGDNVWLNTAISGRNTSWCVQTATGIPAPSGLTPTLGGKGPFHVGNAVDLRLTGAPPQTNGVVMVTLEAASAGLLQPSGVFGTPLSRSATLIHVHTSGTPGLPGTGSWRLPFTVPAYVANTTRTYVAFLPDPQVPGGFVRSNEFSIHYAP